MNSSRRLGSLFLVLIIVANVTIAADKKLSNSISDTTYIVIAPSQPRIHEFSLWGGYAFDSFRFWGKTPDATIQSLGFRYNRKLLNLRKHQLEYTLQMNFYSKYNYPDYRNNTRRISLFGAGLSPIGFQLNFTKDNPLQPFINSSGGVMGLEGPFPDERGKKLNFTFTVGTGFEIILTRHTTFTLGIKYHHLSNFYRGEVNPGIDSSLIYTAITFF